MNELEQTLQEILKKSIEIAEQTGEFVMEQAPLLLQEFYRWHLYSNILGVILTAIIIFIIYRISKWAVKDSNDDGFFYFINLFSAIPFLFTCINIYNIVFILVAPKLYLIEYFL